MALSFTALRAFINEHILNKLPEVVSANDDVNPSFNHVIDKIEEVDDRTVNISTGDAGANCDATGDWNFDGTITQDLFKCYPISEGIGLHELKTTNPDLSNATYVSMQPAVKKMQVGASWSTGYSRLTEYDNGAVLDFREDDGVNDADSYLNISLNDVRLVYGKDGSYSSLKLSEGSATINNEEILTESSKIEPVADSSAGTISELNNKINELLAAARLSGILKT